MELEAVAYAGNAAFFPYHIPWGVFSNSPSLIFITSADNMKLSVRISIGGIVVFDTPPFKNFHCYNWCKMLKLLKMIHKK